MDDNEKRELAIGRAAARNDLMIRVRRNITTYAGVAELADALDLGSNTPVCRFKSCRPYQNQIRGFGPRICIWPGAAVRRITPTFVKDESWRPGGQEVYPRTRLCAGLFKLLSPVPNKKLCSAGGLSSVKIGKALDISRVLTYNA